MFLLVQHNWGHWSFPKWHIEDNETPLQSAKREVLEETGILNIKIVPKLYFNHYYSFFDKQGGLIDKRVGFFVWEVYDSLVVLQKAELKDYCWKSFEDSMKILTFESDKKILKKVFLALDD